MGKRFSPYGCTLQIRHTQSENIPRIRMDRQDEQTAKPYQSTHCRRTTHRRSRQKNNALTKGIRGQKYHRRAHENRRTCDDRRVSERMHPPQSGKSTEKANQQTRCPSALTGQTAEAPRKPHENGENPQALESNQASIENSTGAVGKTFRTRHSRSLPILQSNNASVKGKRRVLCRMQKVYFAGLDKPRAIRYNQGRRFLMKG